MYVDAAIPLTEHLRCDNPITSGIAPARPCRRCTRCLRYKSYYWTMRNEAEMRHAHKTCLLRLSFRYKRTDAHAYASVQKFLKRIRKKWPATSFRYAAFAEFGEKGTRRLHYHMLLCANQPFSGHAARALWKDGQTHSKLADAASSAYCAKYVTKGEERPRASNGWGSLPNKDLHLNSTIQETLRYFPNAQINKIRIADRPVPRRLFARERDAIRTQQLQLQSAQADSVQQFRSRKLQQDGGSGGTLSPDLNIT